MMKMIGKAGIGLLCVLLLCQSAACQLAQEDAGTNTYEDRLIGVWVTTAYLDVFNIEGYLTETVTVNRLPGGEIVMQGKADAYQERIYASLVPVSLTSETGEVKEISEYVFAHTTGIPYFAPTVQDEHGGYISSVSDEAISEGSMQVAHGDDTKSVTMEGTLYVLPASTHIYYLNPVYQSADGRVYLTAGSGIAASGTHDEGLMMSQTLDNTYTVSENGKSKTDNFSITISVSFMFAPEEIIVLQMDADGERLSRTAYAPDALPETLVPEAKTAYLIVETHKRDATGCKKVSRDIYSSGAEAFDTFYARADGICVKRLTPILWPDENKPNE